MYIWQQLSTPAGKEDGLNIILGNQIGNTGAVLSNSNGNPNSVELFVPLTFFFNRNYGLALPLIALQYHDVRLVSPAESIVAGPNASNLAIKDPQVIFDYIYLDNYS